MSITPGLARELGAIASGETQFDDDDLDALTKRFATGLILLIDEGISAAVAPLVKRIDMLEAAERDGSATLAREDVHRERAASDRALIGLQFGVEIPVAAKSAAQAVVVVGNAFLCLRDPRAGRVFAVSDVNGRHVTAESKKLPCDRVTPWIMGDADMFLDPEEFRRVPVGYEVPPVADLLAGVVRLLEAYWAMCANPETGRGNIDATAREMAAMAGMEVPT